MPFDIDTLTDEGKKFVVDLQAQIAAASDAPATLPDDMPDVVKARFDENDATIAKMQVDNERVSKENAALRDEMATEKWTVRASELAPLFGDVKTADVFKALDAAAPAEFAKLNGMFDTATAVVKSSPLFKELGDASSEGSAVDQITAHADALRKDNSELTMAGARAEAWKRHPELKIQSREEGT